MQLLSLTECEIVSGGDTPRYIWVGVGALAGGVTFRSLSSWLLPYSTLVGTVGLGTSGALACSLIAPGPGTVIGLLTGATAGYLFSATFTGMGLFTLGCGAGGYVTNYLLP